MGLFAAGMRRRDRLGSLLRLGGWPSSRDVANQSLRRLFGVGTGRDVIEIQKTFTVQAPVEDVFDLWIDCESFPLFMDHLRRVEPLGEGGITGSRAAPPGSP